MKNNFGAIYQLFVAIPVTIFLIIFFYYGEFMARLLLTPFIVCAIATLFKSIFTLKGNVKWSEYCNRVYIISVLVYVLGFFVAFWYLAIKNQIYSLMIILFVVSVIIIVAIRHRFFKKRESKEEMAKENKRFLIKNKIKKKVRTSCKTNCIFFDISFRCCLIMSWCFPLVSGKRRNKRL